MSWINTHSGERFYLFAPVPARVWGVDLAHALAQLCRFGGHTAKFYSVAQHSVLVSRLVPAEQALAALLHDAAEAYLGDTVTPLKSYQLHHCPALAGVEETIRKAVFQRFGAPQCPHKLTPEIKAADVLALATERRDLLENLIEDWELPLPEPLAEPIMPWPAAAAEKAFNSRLWELSPRYGRSYWAPPGIPEGSFAWSLLRD